MEKKYKISEFAALLGITPKTVYRMEVRKEITTVNEMVNHRLTKLVIATDKQIEDLRHAYSKYTGFTGDNDDNLSENDDILSSNNQTQNSNNTLTASEVLEKIVSINEQYNIRINELNEQLIDSKSKLLLLEDKAGREGMYLKEINELKQDNKELMRSKQTLFNLSVIVIGLLLLVIIGLFTYNVMSQKNDIQNENKNTNTITKIETPVKATKKR